MPQKFFIFASEIALVIASYFVLFEDFLTSLRAFGVAPHPTRNLTLFVFNVVTLLRFLLTLFVFLRRKIPVEEALSVSIAFTLYLLGFPLLAKSAGVPFGPLETLGITVFAAGSLLNTASEYQRHLFKQRPENRGRLYDQGLFSLSIHINYFGDLLWVTGYACVTHSLYAFVIPGFLFCFFYFFNIPQLDTHLRKRYGAAFVAYEERTKRFVPFLL